MGDTCGAGLDGLEGGETVIKSVCGPELEPPQDANKNEVQNNAPSEGCENEVSEITEEFADLYDTGILKFPNKVCHTIIITSLRILSSSI